MDDAQEALKRHTRPRMLTVETPKQKTVALRRFDAALYAQVKARAKVEGVRVGEWIERALTHELVRVRREQMRAEVGEEAAEGAG